MFDQELLSMWGEWRLREVLEGGNYPSDYLSLDESNIWHRIALENYILKCNATPHGEKEKMGIKQYKRELLDTFTKHPEIYTISILLKEENAESVFTKEELLKLNQTKRNITSRAHKLYLESKKRELTDEEKNTLMTFFIATMDTKNEGLKSSIEDYAKNILDKNVIPENDMEFKFILSYFHRRMLTDKNLGDNYENINCGIYLTQKPQNILGCYSYNNIFVNINSNYTLSEAMHVVCHETRHAIQDYQSKHDPNSVVGFLYTVNNLLYRHYKTKEYDPYHCNYRYQDIERDAEEDGYRVASSIYFYLGYYDISASLKEQKQEGFHRRAFEYEFIKDENGKKFPKEIYNVTHMNRIIEKHPDYLKKYIVLRQVYHEDGSAKSFEEMLATDIMANEPGYYKIFHDYLIYYVIKGELEHLDLDKLSKEEKVRTLKHLISMFQEECNLVIQMTKYEKDMNVSSDQRSHISKYHLQITSSLASFLSKNYQTIEKMTEDEELGPRFDARRYISDFRDLKHSLSRYEQEDEFKESLNTELSKLKESYRRTFRTRNWLHLQKHLKKLDEETLQSSMTMPNGTQVSFKQYCEEYIFRHMNSHRQMVLPDGEKTSISEAIKTSLNQIQNNDEVSKQTPSRHK